MTHPIDKACLISEAQAYNPPVIMVGALPHRTGEFFLGGVGQGCSRGNQVEARFAIALGKYIKRAGKREAPTMPPRWRHYADA